MAAGKSWKREAARFGFLPTLAFLAYAVWYDSQMAFASATALLPFTSGFMVTAYGLHGWKQYQKELNDVGT